MAVDAREAAKKFVARLGIVGEAAFAALQAHDVKTSHDKDTLVPAEVSRAWQRWCLEHPDKGGNNEMFVGMQQGYDACKMWFAREAAQKFVAKLGIVREASFAALLAPGVETSDDNKMPVPTEVKKAWKCWCLKGHPDRGGTNETFQEMQQEYDAFKSWFAEHLTRPSMDRVKMLAEYHERGTMAEAAAQKSQEENRHEEAMVFATQAIAWYRALYNVYHLDKKFKMKADAKAHVQCAKDLYGAIQMEAESIVKAAEETKCRNETELLRNKEHQDMTLGLDRLLKCVPEVASHGLAIPQKYDELVKFLVTREQKHTADIAGLESDACQMRVEIDSLSRQLQDAEQAHNEGQMQQQKLSNEVCLLQGQNSVLKKQQDEAMQELNADNHTGVLQKVSGWFGLGTSPEHSTPLKASIAAKNSEIQQLKQEKIELHERLGKIERTKKKMECTIQDGQQALAQKDEQTKILEADYDALWIKANSEIEQLKRDIQQLQRDVAESESMLAQQQEVYEDHCTRDKETAAAQMERQRKMAVQLQHKCSLAMSMMTRQKTHTTKKLGFEHLKNATAERIKHTAKTRKIEMRLMNRVQVEALYAWSEKVRYKQHNCFANQVVTTEGPLAVVTWCSGEAKALPKHVPSGLGERHSVVQEGRESHGTTRQVPSVYNPDTYQDYEIADRQVCNACR